jgi:DNA-binding MarR family transcriptional regulator
MRPSSIVRISVPKRGTPAQPPRRNAAQELLKLKARLDTLLHSLPAPKLTETELKVLGALPRRGTILARDLGQGLGMDAGYLSRMLARLEDQGLIKRGSDTDGRRAPLSLTAGGRLILRRLAIRREWAVAQALEFLSEPDRNELAEALAKASEVLERQASAN